MISSFHASTALARLAGRHVAMPTSAASLSISSGNSGRSRDISLRTQHLRLQSRLQNNAHDCACSRSKQ